MKSNKTAARKQVTHSTRMNFEAFRRRLMNERHRLLGGLGEYRLEEQEIAAVADEADLATAHLERETRSELVFVRSGVLDQIDHALLKLKNGSYGVCEQCGQPIPQARLRIVPFATLCCACKQREERAGAQMKAASQWAHMFAPAAEGTYDTEMAGARACETAEV